MIDINGNLLSVRSLHFSKGYDFQSSARHIVQGVEVMDVTLDATPTGYGQGMTWDLKASSRFQASSSGGPHIVGVLDLDAILKDNTDVKDLAYVKFGSSDAGHVDRVHFSFYTELLCTRDSGVNVHQFVHHFHGTRAAGTIVLSGDEATAKSTSNIGGVTVEAAATSSGSQLRLSVNALSGSEVIRGSVAWVGRVNEIWRD